MLKLILELFKTPSEVEARMLRQLCKNTPELPDWSAAVQPVLTRLLQRNSNPRSMVSRVLYKMPFNALALPYKTIVVAQSLVDFCRDERDQIAFVLAHEVAHIHLGHAGERSRLNAFMTLLRATNVVAEIGLRFLLDRAFSREQELEADRFAVRFCARAGYAPQAAADFLERLPGVDRSIGVGQLLDTHPPLKERISQIRSVIYS